MNTLNNEIKKLIQRPEWRNGAIKNSGIDRRRIDAYVKAHEAMGNEKIPLRYYDPLVCPFNDSTCPYWHSDGYCYFEKETGDNAQENCPYGNFVFM